MSRHNDLVSMRQMPDHAREALTMVIGRNRSDMKADRMLQLALTRLVEIVGEAASRVSPHTREKHAQISWLDIVGMRNRLIHGYDVIDFDLLWNTLEIDLPLLISQLEPIVERKN